MKWMDLLLQMSRCRQSINQLIMNDWLVKVWVKLTAWILTRHGIFPPNLDSDDCFHGYLRSRDTHSVWWKINVFQNPKGTFWRNVHVADRVRLHRKQNHSRVEAGLNWSQLTVMPHHWHLYPARHSEAQQVFLHTAHFELFGKLPSLQWCSCFTNESSFPGRYVAFSLQSATAKSWHSMCTK